MVGFVGLPQQQASAGGGGRDRCSREEVRIAGGDDRLAGQHIRRGDGRGAAGIASTGRARARPSGRSSRIAATRPRADHCVARRAHRRPRPTNITSPACPPPRRRAASRCSSCRRATSAMSSASTSQVPFDPSVQTRWWTTQPSAAHFASVRAAPELDVVGMCADRQRDARRRKILAGDDRSVGGRRLARFVGVHRGDISPRIGRSTGGDEWMPAVVDRVDVDRESWVDADRDRGACCERRREMVAEAAASVGGRKRDVAGAAEHVGAVAAAVGNQHDRPRRGEPRQIDGERQIAVRDDHVVGALAGDRVDPLIDRTVEPEAGAPQHVGAERLGPGRDFVVVAGDERRQRSSRSDDTRSAIQRARRARSGSGSQPANLPLAAWNALIGISTAVSTGPP